MYISQLHHKRQFKEKNQVSFAELNSINQKLEDIYQHASRQGARMLANPEIKESPSNKSLSTIISIAKKFKSRGTKQTESFTESVSKPRVKSQVRSDYHQMAGVQIFFRNAFTKERRPLLVRPGTAISRAPSNDFPSPRVGMGGGAGNNMPKNYEILPNLTEDSMGRRIDSQDYDKAHFG
jgi:hypothetical protein